ncbi:ATP-grasp domain-containing protein [uncultured Desulfovibrio sp.]|uniref:ATP-grasp domain-containing protein n=2 Tax=uncultured Desulfovibrio sp. TaxID=167968 RepID=UPI0025F0BF58|nr:ATP-grasp domain-containing protein [uncultured Desulfovibrio sp.]
MSALSIERAEDLREALCTSPFRAARLCVKPVQGVYGQGFRILDDSVGLRDVLADTAGRRVPSAWYLRLLEESSDPLLLMPYCGGDEYSVDMLVRQERALCAVQRRKYGPLQDLEAPGKATEIAYECARPLGCDGLVNIQRIEAEKAPLSCWQPVCGLPAASATALPRDAICPPCGRGSCWAGWTRKR